MIYIIPFGDINMTNLHQVGGKNASLGEMFNNLMPRGIRIPDGFAVTAKAYRKLLDDNGICKQLEQTLQALDRDKYTNLNTIGEEARSLILSAKMPKDIIEEVKRAYRILSGDRGEIDVAVRSSATAEDLPTASFAGQLESFLNIRGEEQLIETIHRCFTSLFTDRAIKYREDQGFTHTEIAISVGIQCMVRSDKACSGVAFTLDPDSGFDKVIIINGIWGLGENLVQGRVTPDEFVVFKETLGRVKQPIVARKFGSKKLTMVYSDDNEHKQPVINLDTPPGKQDILVLNDEEIVTLADWCKSIESHYQRPMDIEWAKDGIDGLLYVVQARPETIHALGSKDKEVISYKIKEKGKVLTQGIALGEKIAAGEARVLHAPSETHKLQAGDVLITDITNPDWDPVMKKAAAIVTNKGGRTSHAAIVARELGVVAVVGAGNATEVIANGQQVTVSCAEGKVGYIYDGRLSWEEKKINLSGISIPETAPLFILGDPDRAFQLSFYPNKGVGLLRLEFIIANSLCVHPLALIRFDELIDNQDKRKIEHLTRHYKDKRKILY